MQNQRATNAMDSIAKSPFMRILALGFLVLLLQIPIWMIQGAIGERHATRNEAVNEVTGKWGRSQTIIGPLITVPYIESNSEVRYATFLPETLDTSGKIDCKVRYRGIFKVPIYRMSSTFTGQFARPDLSKWNVDAANIMWDKAYLSVGISDARAITKQVVLKWNGEKVPFLPGAGEADAKGPGIHADLKSLPASEGNFKFSFTLNLNGSQKAFFAPLGKETLVDLESNWSDPSFQGAWLPSKRTVTQHGFKASWTIPFIGRNYPQAWTSAESMDNAVSSSVVGVSLISPVDQYRMVERSIKYVTLFLALTFVILWLFEVLAKIRIHMIQYLLVGAGMCLFYLLELSFAEHIGFNAAYTVAGLAIVALVSSYCVAVLKSASRAMIIGGMTVLLYGYLYVLLKDQDYALLIGSVGLFVILATIMFLTRKVDWYSAQANLIPGSQGSFTIPE
jgi:inner membrane protein